MTTITLHGILAKEFGSCFYLNIRKAKDAISAINANYSHFSKRIVELSQEGLHYAIIVDGKNIKDHLELEVKTSPMTIDIIPMICGSGIAVAAIGAIAMYASTLTAVTAIGAGFATAVGMVGAMLLSVGIQMMLAPNGAKAGKAPSIEVGGIKESFIFSSKANLVEQGTPVPVGYGRLRIGSNVIAVSVKSYPIKNNVNNQLSTSSLDVETTSARIIRR